MAPGLSPLNEFIAGLQSGPTAGRYLWQLGVLALAVLLGWLLARQVCRRVKPSPRWKFGEGDFERVAIPLFILGFTFLGKVLLGRYRPVALLEIVDTLLLAWVAVRIAIYVLGHILPPGAFLRTAVRTIAWAVWIAVALQVTGFLAEVLTALDEIGFTWGKEGERFTLLLLLKAVAALVLTIMVALWISRITESRVLSADGLQMSTRIVVSKVVRVSVLFIAVLIALPLVGIPMTALSVFSGALGVGLGFGLQKVASNYVSGFIVLLDRSLRVGDFVTVGGIRGEVRAIEARYTVLRSLDGNEAIIPNETLITQNVLHHTYSDPKVTVTFEVSVSYDSDVDRACELLQEIAARQARLVDDPPPAARVRRLAESGVDLELTAWIRDPALGEGELRSAVYREILRTFRAAGIDIPYPRRDVRVLATPETAKSPIETGT